MKIGRVNDGSDSDFQTRGERMLPLNRRTMETLDSKNFSVYESKNENFLPQAYVPDTDFSYKSIRFIRVTSLMISKREMAAEIVREQIQNTITALWSMKCAFTVLAFFDGLKYSLYIGSLVPEHVEHIAEGCFSGIEFGKNRYTFDELKDEFAENGLILNNAGFFYGNPVVKDFNEKNTMWTAMDNVITGTSGMTWALSITCMPMQYDTAFKIYRESIAEATRVSSYISANYNGNSGNVNESIATTTTYIGSQLYHEYSLNSAMVQKEALETGAWSVSCVCFTNAQEDLRLFGSIYSSQMKAGNEELKRPRSFNFTFIGNLSAPAGCYLKNKNDNICMMSSRELSAVFPLPVNDQFGLKIVEHTEFDVSTQKEGELVLGNILKNSKITSAEYSLDPHSLNRHGLVIGLTGGGKTNTVKSILYSISNLRNPLPFMVIEPAKKEYYEAYKMGIKNLQVYSVGSLTDAGFKINPFERIDGIPLQSHIDAVFSAFKASFILYSPMPYVLETAIYDIYKDYGWDVEKEINIYGRNDYPTIEDLYFKLPITVKRMGYDTRMENDLIGSLKSRINSLRLGAKGRTLNTAKSMPMTELLKGNVIIELEDIGDEDAKAFIISIILMQIQECRKAEIKQHQLDVQHVLLIEEAHRLLKNIASGSGENADPRGAAVEYFCNMLAELRSKGQGFLVIDQIPSKLAPDLVKNTNLKIIHRTVAEEDRNLVGGAMNMTDQQKEYLACLKQGVAAVYSEGDNRPKLVKLPYAGDYETKSGLSNMSRNMILNETKKNSYIVDEKGVYKNLSGSNGMCRLCRNLRCGGIKDEKNLMSEALGAERYRSFRQQLEKKLNDFTKISDITQLLKSNYEKNVGYMVDGNERVGFKKVDKLRCVMAMIFDISDYSFENIALLQNAFIDMLKKHMNDE